MASEVRLISPLTHSAQFLLWCWFDFIYLYIFVSFPDDVFLALLFHPLLANNSGFVVVAGGLVDVAAADVVAGVTVVAAVAAVGAVVV